MIKIEIYGNKILRVYKDLILQIIQAVGIFKGGVYHHFSNKEEIFLELLKDGSSYRKKVVLEHMNGSIQDRGEKIIDILLDKILDKNPYKA